MGRYDGQREETQCTNGGCRLCPEASGGEETRKRTRQGKRQRSEAGLEKLAT